MSVVINIDKVVDIYSSLIGGEISSEDRVFCKSAVSMLEKWLNPKKVTPDDEYNICYAAATMANYRKHLKQGTELSDFKAGDITVNDNSEATVKNAHLLYNDALESIGNLLKPRSFAFVNVKG